MDEYVVEEYRRKWLSMWCKSIRKVDESVLEKYKNSR